jgi:hypothetical protein
MLEGSVASVYSFAILDETYLPIVFSNPLILGSVLWQPSPLDTSVSLFELTNASHPVHRLRKN